MFSNEEAESCTKSKTKFCI